MGECRVGWSSLHCQTIIWHIEHLGVLRFYLFLSLLLHTGILGLGALFWVEKVSYLQFPVVTPHPFKELVEVRLFPQDSKGFEDSEDSKGSKNLSLKKKGSFSEKQKPKAATSPSPLKNESESKNNSHSKNKSNTAFSPQQVLAKTFDEAIIQNALPIYPSLALRHGWAGNVLLRVFVDSNGKVKKVRVLEGSRHSVLNQSAIRAARQWVFKPSDYPYQLQKKIVFKINFL